MIEDHDHAPHPDYDPITLDQRWWMSGNMAELFTSLAKFQAGETSAAKSGRNPHLKSKYADLSDVYTCSKRAAELGLSVTTFPIKGDNPGECEVVATLGHSSGAYIMTRFMLMPTKKDVQGWGGVFTYARRYATQMMLGIAADEDMDGEDTKKVVRTRKAPAAAKSSAPVDYPAQIKSAKGDGELRNLWRTIEHDEGLSVDQRTVLLDSIKEKRGQ